MVNVMERSLVRSRGVVEISLVASLAFGFYRVAGYLPSFRRSGVKMPEAGLPGQKNDPAPIGETQKSWKGAMADQLAQDIIDKIKAHAEPDGEEITLKTELTELGIHSLELTEIIFDLEEAYGIEIEMNTVEAWSTLKNVGDMVEAVRGLIAKQA
jgi:nodulation protein F